LNSILKSGKIPIFPVRTPLITAGSKLALSGPQPNSTTISISRTSDKLSSYDKKTGKYSCEFAYGITSRTPEQADPERVLAVNRGHWCIENSCHYIIDWNYDEDRNRIRKGHGPENITRLRRFAISIIKSKGVRSVAQKMRQLTFNVRLVFDYLRMTKNSNARALPR
jgi:hypothetical protein